jgi:hypothetical protein
MGTYRPHCHYRKMTAEETFPAYESLIPVVQILADVLESPASWARAKLRDMTGRDVNWKALKSASPNITAEGLALRVLKAAHSLRPLEPSYVTASAEGGVGIVYKSDRRYAAIECLNSGQMWILWFDVSGEPQSRRVKKNDKGINQALEQIAALHANA